MILDQLREVVGHHNVKAFARVVRQGESSQDDIAYQMRFPGKTFDNFSTHPNVREPIPWSPGEVSTAAGAYQITYTTFSGLRKKYGLPETFTPADQDLAFVCILYDCGALPFVLNGNFERAIHECVKPPCQWTSLPGGSENPQSMAKAMAVYEKYGGTYATQPAAQIDDHSIQEPAMPDVLSSVAAAASAINPAVGLGLGLANAVINTFSGLAQEKIAKEIGRHVDKPVAEQFAANIIDNVRAVVGVKDNKDVSDIQAVGKYQEMAKQNPQLAHAMEADTLKDLNDLLPVIQAFDVMASQKLRDEDQSRDLAMNRGITIQKEGPIWNNPTFLIAAFVLILVATTAYAVLFRGGFSTDMQAFVIGAIVGTAFTSVLSFFFGSTRSSGAKDVVLSELSLRQQAKDQ